MLEKFKSRSLKAKITISAAFTAIVLCVGAVAFVYFYLLNNLYNEKINFIKEVSTEQSHEETQILLKDMLFAKMLGTRTRVKEFMLDRTEARRIELLGIFSDYTKDDHRYLAVSLLDTKGVCIISTDERFVGQDYGFRDFFKNALLDKPSIDVAVGVTSNEFGYYFSYPVKDDKGNILGVVVVKVDGKEVGNSVLHGELAKNNTVMFVDQFGVIMSSNRTERYFESLGVLKPENSRIIANTKRFNGSEIMPLQYDLAQNIVDGGQSGEVKFYDKEDGENEIVTVIKFPDLPFSLVTEIGVEDVKDSVLFTVFTILSIFAAGILLWVIIIYRLLNRLLSPLQKLKKMSEAINNGDFSQRIEIENKDELGDLANTFNKMSEGLTDTYKSLEQKVQERTSDLQKTLLSMDKILETKVEERTSDIKKKLDETEAMNKLMTGREVKMAEMKKELDELKTKHPEDKI